MGRDVGRIAEEVIQHLTSLIGSTVEIILEIQATIPDGVPENVVRTVTENCLTTEIQVTWVRGGLGKLQR